MAEPTTRIRCWWTGLAFVALAAFVVGGVAGPGLSWDEPAYRHSQVTLESWLRDAGSARSPADVAALFSAERVDRYWEYNRFGHNFHPPLAGYLNLLSFGLLGGVWDDISARRVASALLLAATATYLGHFLARRYGPATGLLAGVALVAMPRLVGHAHVIGTDVPLLCFWVLTALTFWDAQDASRPGAGRAQWLCGVGIGLLFLVKFSGLAILPPLAAWFTAVTLGRHWRRRVLLGRWARWTLLIVGPLVLPAATLLWGLPATQELSLPRLEEPMRGAIAGATVPPEPLRSVAALGIRFPWLALLLLWPLAVWLWHARRRPDAEHWDRALELPWTMLAVAPLVVLGLNPSWWHEPLFGLAQFFRLNLDRESFLPEIAIFYLGEQYVYSLPWHNAFGLTAVTVPFGLLGLAAVGLVRSLTVERHDALRWYFLLQMLTLPLVRMLPTPAHDGVRLFLPTFAFLAGFAAWGGLAVVRLVAQRWPGPWAQRAGWAAVLLIGPGWGLIDVARSHPHELSYYNVGLRRAVALGFEPTYWYDAVTPAVLHDLNERLPANQRVVVQVDPRINPEVFFALQQLGRLRSDLLLEPTPDGPLPWVLLLTHSSKSTPFTRLLYAVEPWYAHEHASVRLFSVVDEPGVSLAWALDRLLVVAPGGPQPGGPGKPPTLRESLFAATPEQLGEITAFVQRHPPSEQDGLSVTALAAEIEALSPPARDVLRDWYATGRLDPAVARVVRHAPGALERALVLIARRGDDIRRVLRSPGYLLPHDFGGTFARADGERPSEDGSP